MQASHALTGAVDVRFYMFLYITLNSFHVDCNNDSPVVKPRLVCRLVMVSLVLLTYIFKYYVHVFERVDI